MNEQKINELAKSIGMVNQGQVGSLDRTFVFRLPSEEREEGENGDLDLNLIEAVTNDEQPKSRHHSILTESNAEDIIETGNQLLLELQDQGFIEWFEHQVVRTMSRREKKGRRGRSSNSEIGGEQRGKGKGRGLRSNINESENEHIEGLNHQKISSKFRKGVSVSWAPLPWEDLGEEG